MITKHATVNRHCRHTVKYYNRARDGMYDFLRALREEARLECILLPSYIGYSPTDGSGVFDPVAQVDGLNYIFYHVDLMLQIDMESVREALCMVGKCRFVLLRMDYYGFTDQNAELLYHMVHEYGGYVLEDNAHSIPIFQELFGFWSDAVFYAAHKILPLSLGSILMLRNPDLEDLLLTGGTSSPNVDFWSYDFHQIATIRRENFLQLEELIEQYRPYLQPMRSLANDPHTIPYSFPVILKRDDRFSLYNYLNDQGYGVTCLYYAIIAQIPKDRFPESVYLSDHILNFPVHQDVDSAEYPRMLAAIEQYCNEGGHL